MSKKLSLCAALCLSACIWEPMDDSVPGRARLDGTPPPFEVAGFGISGGVPIEIEVKNQVTGAFEPLAPATTTAATDLVDGLYAWSLGKQKLRRPEHIGTRTVAGEVQRFVELRGFQISDGRRNQLLTFDRAGRDCVDDKIHAGKTAVQAGQECHTGNTVTVAWRPYQPGPRTPAELGFVTGTRCEQFNTLYATPGENRQWAASVMTPPGAPFAVENVSYRLVQQGACDAGVAHTVNVFVTRDGRPAARPDVLRTFTVDEASLPAGGTLTKTLRLDPPLVVEDGEKLVVSVQLPNDGTRRVCLPTCADRYTPGTSWWSNAVNAPFSWVDLSSFGPAFTAQIDVRASGFIDAAP
jgi:hypothetical protein